MIEKQCQFSTKDDNGEYLHILRPGYDNQHLVKTAAVSPPQLKIIQRFMKQKKKEDGVLYALLSALGAGEYWSCNSNGDYFGLDRLVHTPVGWHDMPYDQQKLTGVRWEWGYPTFYNAHSFAHHQNKDPLRSFGTVDYVNWDPHMKRVLLVVGFSRSKAVQFGGQGALDRLENGEFPSVSMGCRVVGDFCSICTDWSRVNPLIDRPVDLLREHKKRPIVGFSTVTGEYCQHLQNELRKIYFDGRQVKMLNLHPRFFDISLVFIGADKTSYILAKLAHGQCPIKVNSPVCKQGCTQCSSAGAVLSSHVYDVWDRNKVASTHIEVPSMAKIAAKEDQLIKEAFEWNPDIDDDVPVQEQKAMNRYFKGRVKPLTKKSEITKRVSSNFRKKAIPALELAEPDMPPHILDDMSDNMSDSLSTCGGLGMVVKPREFQRMYIRAIGRPELSDDLDRKGIRFKDGAPPGDFRLSESILPSLLKSLLPMMRERSSLGPPLHRRVVITIRGKAPKEEGCCQCMEDPLLDKIGSDYSAYRRDLLYKIASLVNKTIHENPQVLSSILGDVVGKTFHGGLAKEGCSMMESMIGMLPAAYLNRAYMNRPVSRYVEDHCHLGGLIKAGELAAVGGLA
ncbi:MAG: hypothetical protein ACXAEU_17115 [Candidatus Hodarchaeales archaeon]|jgi:hypothetical protein